MMEPLKIEGMPSREIPVRKGAVMSLAGLPQGSRLICISGMVWLTREGDRDDHILAGGRAHDIGGTGLVVLEGLADSVVLILSRSIR